MPRSMLAAAVVAVAVLTAPVPNTLPLPDTASQTAGKAAQSAPARNPVLPAPPAPADGTAMTGLPATDLPMAGAAPDPVAADLARFGASQGLSAPERLHVWISDLNGDGRPDVLAQASYRKADGAQVLYHFPYFAGDNGYRRGSALVLSGEILSVAQQGGALIVTVARAAGGDGACCPGGKETLRLRF